jgi:hypothetical protein
MLMKLIFILMWIPLLSLSQVIPNDTAVTEIQLTRLITFDTFPCPLYICDIEKQIVIQAPYHTGGYNGVCDILAEPQGIYELQLWTGNDTLRLRECDTLFTNIDKRFSYNFGENCQLLIAGKEGSMVKVTFKYNPIAPEPPLPAPILTMSLSCAVGIDPFTETVEDYWKLTDLLMGRTRTFGRHELEHSTIYVGTKTKKKFLR